MQLLDLSDLGNQLSGYDNADLLSKVGALNLDPRNASRAFSLEALAYLVGSLPIQKEAPRINQARFRNLLSEHLDGLPLHSNPDDNAPQSYAVEFFSNGESFIVFPGHAVEITDLLRWLLNSCVLQSVRPWPRGFRDDVARAARLCLGVSNRIALKSGITRGTSIKEDRNSDIAIPDLRNLRTGTAAVTFSQTDLATMIPDLHAFKEAIAPLSIPLGNVDWDAYGNAFGQLQHAPFVRAGNNFIIPNPTWLLTGLLHRILSISKKYGVLAMLDIAVSEGVWSEVQGILKNWGSSQIASPLPQTKGSRLKEALFSLDTDKAIYLQVATEDLQEFAGEHEPLSPLNDQLALEMKARTEAIVGDLSSSATSSPVRVLALMVYQPVSGATYIGLDPVKDSIWLVLSASELRTIALLDSDDPLALWKFGRAAHRVRDFAKVISFNTLDEYAFYRGNFPVYSASHKREQGCLIVPPGAGQWIHRRITERLDPHCVLSYDARTVEEVWNIPGLGGSVSCSRVPFLPRFGAPLVVEGAMPFPIWVKGPRDIIFDDVHSAPIDIAAIIAFWLWQSESLLSPLLAEAASGRKAFLIEIFWGSRAEWLSNAEEGKPGHLKIGIPLISNVESSPGGIRITLNPNLLILLTGVEDECERRLARELILVLRKEFCRLHPHLEELHGATAFELAIDSVAPSGPKRWSIPYASNAILNLGDLGLPKARPKQEDEENAVHNEISDFLRGKKGRKSTQKEVRNLINEVVSVLFSRLTNLVAKLDANKLIERLVAYQEVQTWELATQTYRAPARLAYCENREAFIERLAKENAVFDATSMANRFLVEYVVAQPPSGFQPWSLETYDRLLALTKEIVHLGTVSDYLKYDLAKVNVIRLPTGRLEFQLYGLETNFHDFTSRVIDNEVDSLQDLFQVRIENPANEESVEDDSLGTELDQAFAEDFGVTPIELMQLMKQIYGTGNMQMGPAKVEPMGALISSLSKTLEWDEEKVVRGVNFITLGPRDSYEPQGGESGREVYPWRLNRNLSYMRRPLLLCNSNGNNLCVWGNRHFVNAQLYLRDLLLGERLREGGRRLERAMGKIRELNSRNFEVLVWNVVIEKTGFSAIQNYEVGINLGDVDVLALLPARRLLLAIECKDFVPARSPREIVNQVEKLQKGSESTKPTVDLHLARVRWLEANLGEVLQKRFDVTESEGWQVKPVLVSSIELAAPYFEDFPFPVWSIETLRRMTVAEIVAKV